MDINWNFLMQGCSLCDGKWMSSSPPDMITGRFQGSWMLASWCDVRSSELVNSKNYSSKQRLWKCLLERSPNNSSVFIMGNVETVYSACVHWQKPNDCQVEATQQRNTNVLIVFLFFLTVVEKLSLFVFFFLYPTFSWGSAIKKISSGIIVCRK